MKCKTKTRGVVAALLCATALVSVAPVSSINLAYSCAVRPSSLVLGNNPGTNSALGQTKFNLGLRGFGDADHAGPNDEAEMTRLLEDLFSKIDKDKSGSLELDELKQFLLEAGIFDLNLPFRPDFNIPFKVDDEASRGLIDDDVNHDGQISRDEYVASVTKAVKAKGLTPEDTCHLLRDTLSIL